MAEIEGSNVRSSEADDHNEVNNISNIEKKVSWAKLRRVDSLLLEAGQVSFKSKHHNPQVNWARTMSLAFQSLGVIYGDIGTSPLYVYASTFTDGIKNKNDILGVLSLIIYTLVLVPMIKYVFIVLWANDNGDGGTFALYSLICRYAKVSLIPNDQPEDNQLSHYKLSTPSKHLWRAQRIKEKLETSKTIQIFLFLVTILGTSMVIGDGVLTPSISVLSAVSGINALSQDSRVGLSIGILIILFSVQRFGTDKVGFTFAPIVCIWFSFIGGIGLYNLIKYDIGVLRAINPKYIIDYFQRHGKDAWISLGGVVLAITGTEAMFADLGHFSVRAVQISFSGMVFPALICSYIGQAAYLTKFPENVLDTFYSSTPDAIYWPMFVVAVGAAIIASQAMISGAFSIVSQSLSLSCFPRVKVVHTSTKYEGQVYIPEINYMLMIACVVVTFAFKTTENIGHAYGIAVVAVMVITTCMVTLIMIVIWKTSIWLIALFFVVFFSIDIIYLSSVLYKFNQGGYLPLALSVVLMVIMATWQYIQMKRYKYELNNKVSNDYVRNLANNPEIRRMPGIGLLYSELVQGIPPIFPHFVENVPSIHSVIVMVSIKSIPISHVLSEERFLFRQVEPKDYRVFRCVVRYGYKDRIEEHSVFERQIVDSLKEFMRQEKIIFEGVPDKSQELSKIEHSTMLQDGTMLQERSKSALSNSSIVPPPQSEEPHQQHSSRISSSSIQSINGLKSANSSRVTVHDIIKGTEEDIQAVESAMERGVFYLLGEAEVVAEHNSSLFKRFVVNYLYSFLRKNFRQGEKQLAIPRNRLLRVGMTYEL